MKPSLHARLVNSPFEDPCLYVRLLRERRAFLFDAGFTTNLSAGDILKVRDIFISHTHIDHFIGFDSILRLHLRREGPLRLYGPEGFIDCVQGKPAGSPGRLVSAGLRFSIFLQGIPALPGHSQSKRKKSLTGGKAPDRFFSEIYFSSGL